MKCNQCGIRAKSGNFCPNCGDSFEDEFRMKLKSKVKISQTWLAIGVLAIVMFLFFGYMSVMAERTYQWDETIHSTVADKWQYTTTTYVPVGGSEDTSPVYVPVTNWHYRMILTNGKTIILSASDYHNWDVGDAYSYVVTHTSYYEGMEDAPLPMSYYLNPIAVGSFCVLIAIGVMYTRRYKEMKEFRETGDMEVHS